MNFGSNGLFFTFMLSLPPSVIFPQGQRDFNSPDILKRCEMLMGTIFTPVVTLSGSRNLLFITGSIAGGDFRHFLIGIEKKEKHCIGAQIHRGAAVL